MGVYYTRCTLCTGTGRKFRSTGGQKCKNCNKPLTSCRCDEPTPVNEMVEYPCPSCEGQGQIMLRR